MSSYTFRPGALSLSLILLLVVICAQAVPAALGRKGHGGQKPKPNRAQETELATTETTLEERQSQSQTHRIDCKLTFDATMDSLEPEQALQLQDKGCNVLQTSSTNKPADAVPGKDHLKSASGLRRLMSAGSSQPLYELQLVVWPIDTEHDDDFVSEEGDTTFTTTTTTEAATTTTTEHPTFPLYEDQLVVFPQMNFEDENFDYFFDELEHSPQPQPTPTPTPTPTPRPGGTKPLEPVSVVQQYRVKHANGTEEFKLVLSNGVVNYMKLNLKRMGNKVINVQEGYSSVPVPGQKNQIQTLYYIADERGYNVYKIEQGPRPVLPIRSFSIPIRTTK